MPDLTKLSEAENRNRCTLSQYVHIVLSALSLNISNKAEFYTDEYLQVSSSVVTYEDYKAWLVLIVSNLQTKPQQAKEASYNMYNVSLHKM